MKKYGFFGGSFNPVTKAHIELALEIVEKYNLDKVIFVPVGNAYKKSELADETHRWNMLKIATKDYKQLEVSDIELNKPNNLTTLEAFKEIEKQYTNIDKIYIIGADNLFKIISSKDCEELVKNYNYIVIQRDTIDCKQIIETNDLLQQNQENFKIMENIKHSNTSATEVRNKVINRDKQLEGLISKDVVAYIKENKLYEER